MADQTDRYALPVIRSGQSQKEVTHNEALTIIDALLHPAVARDVVSPPVTPVVGEMWIVPAAASGAWAQHSGKIAIWHSGGWGYVVPRQGCVVWSLADNAQAIYDGVRWRFDATVVVKLEIGGKTVVSARQPAILAASGGSVVDSQARSALASVLSALRNHGLIEA